MGSSAPPNPKRVYEAVDELDSEEINPQTGKRPRLSSQSPLHANYMHEKRSCKSSHAKMVRANNQ